jgi:hypothetical protein
LRHGELALGNHLQRVAVQLEDAVALEHINRTLAGTDRSSATAEAAHRSLHSGLAGLGRELATLACAGGTARAGGWRVLRGCR